MYDTVIMWYYGQESSEVSQLMNVISKDSLYYADTYFLPTTLVIISTNLAVGM